MRPLKFNENGKFRILQISDLQDTKATSVDTLEFLEAAIPALQPDLIVLTGDQLDVVGLWGKGEKCKANVRTALEGIMAPIRASGIPFLVTFGNHDCQTGVSNAEQAEIYKEMANCYCFDDLDDGRPDPGTFNQVIMSSDGKRPAMNIYMMDSNSANPKGNGGYDQVHPDQIEWYVNMSNALKAANGGKHIPSILFQHIPVWEMYELLKEAPKGTEGACAAFRSRKGKYFVRNEDLVWYDGTFRECPSCPEEPCEQFEKVLEQGDVFAMFFGHDHYNSFIGKYKGIDLGYCPGAGYNTYGLNPRAMRVFDFDENDVTNYETSVVDVHDFYEKPLYQPVKNFVYINAPENVDAAIPFIIKALIGIVIVVVALILLGKAAPAAVGILLGLAAVGGLGYGAYSFIRNNKRRKEILGKYQNPSPAEEK